LVRDEAKVNGETWRLEWKKPPVSSCGPRDQNMFTCPCLGFAFGQSGEMELVRERAEKVVQRFALAPFFEGKAAQVQLHEPRPGDADKQATELNRDVSGRPAVKVMKLADFDHDGKATEFLLQTSASPCGSVQGIVIGLTVANGEAHAFGTLTRPNEPLALRMKEWEAVRDSKGSVHTVAVACGDRGATEQVEHTISASAKGIDVEEQTYACSGYARGKLVKSGKR
jgi:hypothetical protein